MVFVFCTVPGLLKKLLFYLFSDILRFGKKTLEAWRPGRRGRVLGLIGSEDGAGNEKNNSEYPGYLGHHTYLRLGAVNSRLILSLVLGFDNWRARTLGGILVSTAEELLVKFEEPRQLLDRCLVVFDA